MKNLIRQLPLIFISLLWATDITWAACSNSQEQATTIGVLSKTKAEIAEQAGSITVPGQDSWLFLTGELRHVGVGAFWGPQAKEVSRASNKSHADPLPAILEFKKGLDAAGVELLLVPVPPKVLIYPDALETDCKPPIARHDLHHQTFYELLRKNGVNVLDLTEDLLSARSAEKAPLYLKQDSHWAGPAATLAAQKIADQVRKKSWFPGVTKRKLTVEERTFEITGDLWTALPEPKPAKESITLRFVGEQQAEKLESVPTDPDSPVLVLADSHGLVFHRGGDMHAAGAGLVDQLAYELGFAVDLIAVRGSAATSVRLNLLRKAKKDKNYIAKKKLIIWHFSAREFTESSGWRTLPALPPSGL